MENCIKYTILIETNKNIDVKYIFRNFKNFSYNNININIY